MFTAALLIITPQTKHQKKKKKPKKKYKELISTERGWIHSHGEIPSISKMNKPQVHPHLHGHNQK